MLCREREGKGDQDRVSEVQKSKFERDGGKK